MGRWLAMVVVVASAAGGAQARPHADNMPRGWRWPPSPSMRARARGCEHQLDELGVPWRAAKAAGHVVDPIVVPDGVIGGIAYVDVYHQRPLVMDCQLVLALATFAPHLYELGVREVHVGSGYRWSQVRVGGKTKPVLSRHALGLALDVVSVVGSDGREAVVARDYRNGDQLLLGVERAIDDSGLFRTVLTPKNDPKSHHDHMHVEADPDYREPKAQS